MLVFVKTLTGRTITVEDESGRIESLKDKIEAKEGIPSPCQGLFYVGRKLEDGKTLGDYKVKRDATLYLTVRNPQKI